MEKKDKKIPSSLFEVAFEMVSFIDAMDQKRPSKEKMLKNSYNRSINNVDKTNKR